MRRRLPALILALAIGVVGVSQALAIPIGKPAPEISGGSWINGPALSASDFKGRVVLVEFWTYG